MRILYLNDVVADRELHVTTNYEVSRSLVRMGHHVKCLLFYEREKPQIKGLPHALFFPITMGRWYSPLHKLWFALITVLRCPKDIVLYEPSFWPAAMIGSALRLGSQPMVLDIRSVPVDVEPGLKGKLRNLRYRLALKAAALLSHGLTVITPALSKEVCSALGWNESDVGTWTSGVDMNLFRSIRPAGIPSEDGFDLCAAYHGVLGPTRGLQKVIPALRMLKEEGLRVCFLFIGDGPAQKELEELAVREGVDALVEFCGKVPYNEVPSRLDSCDVGVVPLPDYPGWRVSSPLKLMEYCAMARPVVVSDIEAHRAVLGASSGAFYLEAVTAESIAASLRKVHENKDELARMGKVNRCIAEERFGWDAQARKLQDYLLRAKTPS